MKKNNYRILATAFAMAIMVASPITTLITHAQGLNIDAPEHYDGDGKKPSSSDSGSSNSYSEPSCSYNESNDSYDRGSNHGFNANAPEHYDGDGVKPTAKNPNDVIVRVAGGQTFRNVMNTEHTSYQVYHCGNSIVTFEVTDSEGNTVTYKTVKLEQGEDKLWYENITFADNVDTKDFTLNVTKGDATYLSTELGVSGIKINGTVVLSTVPVEPETEAVIGHRYCSCGASFDIYENSGIDKDAWSAHAREHATKGESARYTDK